VNVVPYSPHPADAIYQCNKLFLPVLEADSGSFHGTLWHFGTALLLGCVTAGGFSTEFPCPDPIGLTSMSNEFE
jgi:hypothetical protein